METQKIDFINKHAQLIVSAVMVCKQFLLCTVNFDRSAFLYNP